MRFQKAFLREEGAEFTRRKEPGVQIRFSKKFCLHIISELQTDKSNQKFCNHALSLTRLRRELPQRFAKHNVRREPFHFVQLFVFNFLYSFFDSLKVPKIRNLLLHHFLYFLIPKGRWTHISFSICLSVLMEKEHDSPVFLTTKSVFP